MLIAAVFGTRRGGAGGLSVVALDATTTTGLRASPQARRQLTSEGARAPMFSPDGRWLAFARNGDVTLTSLVDLAREPTTLAPCHELQGRSAYQFDASSSWLAVALEHGILVLPTSGDGGGRLVPLPDGHRAERLHWSEGGSLLAVSARERDGNPVAVVLDPGGSRVLATSPGVEILAVPDDETVWLVGPRAGLPWAEAFVWRRGGEVASLFVSPDNHLILAPVPRRNALLLVALAEDAGDPADVAIASLSGKEPRSLIQGIPGVCEVGVSSDGGWVTFLTEEDPLAIYLVATALDQSTARRLVLADPAREGSEETDAEPARVVEVACVVTPAKGRA